MKRIYFSYENNQVGCEGNDCFEVEDDITDDELDEMAYCQAIDHASHYGIYMCDEECDDEDCESEHPGDGHISGSWELYDPAVHDCKKPGGGKWFE